VRVYLAAQYPRKEELRNYRELLIKEGVEVTSRWLDEHAAPTSQMGEHTTEFYIETANMDIEDIDGAHAVVFFSEDPLVGIRRGGRHVEFGYAHAKEMPIYVVGPKENVFHYRDRVYHYETFDKFLKAVKNHDIVK